MSQPYGDTAALYLDAGWTGVLPLPPRSKAVPPAGYTGKSGADPSAEEVAAWTANRADGNIALRLPEGIVGIDVDTYGAKDGAASLAALEAALGALPPTVMTTSRDNGSGIRLYRVPAGLDWTDPADDIEVIHHGWRYAVAAPSIHPEGRAYRWMSTHGDVIETIPALDTIPELPAAWVEQLSRPMSQRTSARDVNVEDFLAGLPKGEPSESVSAILRAMGADLDGDRHGAMLRAVEALAVAGAGGASGVPEALAMAEAAFLGAKPEGGRDFTRALTGSVARIADGLVDVYTAPERLAFDVEGYTFEAPRRPRPVADFDRYSTSDAHLGARVAQEYLTGRFIAWGRSAWSRWDGRRWERSTETTVFEAVRQALLTVHATETEAANRRLEAALARIREETHESDDSRKTAVTSANNAHAQRLKSLSGLFNVGKISAVMRVARGRVEVSQEVFDCQPDLLNVANGVVDLRTGDLRAHDPALHFTKITEVAYRPGARHDDWDKALTALPSDVAEWMRVRFGQAATGYSTTDDVVPFLHGGGANGKSTILVGIDKALGDFALNVPDKVLLASPSDHPTELMTLHGARLAFIEELPEGDYLNAQRLKKAVGTDAMTARLIGQDNITWSATHSLMVTTNYDVHVDAVDWGTWRRLALVTFPFTFDGSDPARPKDPTLRDRIKHGAAQHEAALAWVVEGARRWYAEGKVIPPMPPTVRDSTAGWRYSSNLAARFIDEMLELDEETAVRSSDVFAVFLTWAAEAGIRKWNDRTFWTRAQQHGWFRDGAAAKTNGSVRTRGWSPGYPGIPKTFKPQERLVTGVRLSPEAIMRLPLG